MRLIALALKEFFICKLIGHRWRTQTVTIGGFHCTGDPQCIRCMAVSTRPS